jgi:hypothetical protein
MQSWTHDALARGRDVLLEQPLKGQPVNMRHGRVAGVDGLAFEGKRYRDGEPRLPQYSGRPEIAASCASPAAVRVKKRWRAESWNRPVRGPSPCVARELADAGR